MPTRPSPYYKPGKTGIVVEGIEGVMQQLQRVGDVMGGDAIVAALMKAAFMIRDRAKAKVKIGPGGYYARKGFFKQTMHLRDAIFATRGKVRNLFEPSVIVGVDRKKVGYAHLVEFGHGGPQPAGPHPFLRPAADESRMEAVALISVTLEAALAASGIGVQPLSFGPESTGWIG